MEEFGEENDESRSRGGQLRVMNGKLSAYRTAPCSEVTRIPCSFE